ncbi:hypothetical protein [Spirilliplanes yamanashiensis]|uniref:Uncharacterized protein n=1 Tax=Spirilliplanes yamanashiensis TaxID=42233 RepID=A0A8J4DLB3_9ACTN|nr:hypothetical protein [Spirilliplanes yamanashiensis]MDP9816289.1 hypothetical protein [Spirilliplanes yamanashiensis]GIJ05816.1 hypothetical protein Sya03_51680 [Spirilliplanes yamanashiensis]
MLENIFHAFGRAGHEIVFVFGCRLADPALYERDVVGEIVDDAGSLGPVAPLYPAGLADRLARHG